jgi:hypothetical protein
VIGEAEAYGGIPDALGAIEGQARASLDESLPAAMREHSARETCLLVGDGSGPDSDPYGVFEQIIELGRNL